MKLKLGDICEIKAGGTPSRLNQQYWFDGRIPWVKIGDIDGKHLSKTTEFITEEGLNNSSTKLIEKGSILFTIFATLGEVCILDIDATTNQAIAGMTIKDERVDLDYLYYFLKSLKSHVNNIGRGVAQNNINLSILRGFEVPVPYLDKQQKIALSLDKVSQIIEMRKEQLISLDNLIKSRFVEMFGDPIQNPMGWGMKTVDEVCSSIYGGGTPSKQHPEYYDGNIPWVTPKDMKSMFILDSIDHINELGINNSSTKLAPIDSILMVIRSGILKHTLPVAINKVPVTVNQDMKIFITNDTISTYFLAYLFKMIEPDVLTGVRAVTADNIDFTVFRNRLIPVPPIDLQKDYVQFVQQVDKLKVEVQKSLDESQKLFDSLMQKYFD